VRALLQGEGDEDPHRCPGGAESCYAWYSQLIAAKTHTKEVLLNYQTVATHTCNALPTYDNSPAPGYVMVLGT
jgi:hypothetical protein